MQHRLRVGAQVGQWGDLGIERGIEHLGQVLGAGVLEGDHPDLAHTGGLVGVEFGHHVADAFQVGVATGNDECVHAFIGGDHDGQRSALGALAEETLDGLCHLTGVGLGQGNHFDLQAEFGLLGVEPFDEAVNHGHVFHDRSDDEGVHPSVGHDGDGIHRLTPRLGRAVGKEVLQGGLQPDGGGLLEGEDPEVQLGKTILGIELRNDAVQHVDGFLGSGGEDGVEAGVGDDGHRHAALRGVERG